MADEYRWPLQIQNGGNTNYEARIAENQFGDGYSQPQEDGINSVLRTYDLEHVGQTNDPANNPQAVHAFLAQHFVKAFVFTPPHGQKGLFRVKKDSLKYSVKGRIVGQVNCTLVEAVGVLS